MEKAGANVALIGDDKVEYSEQLVMSDDGSGHSINIPSFLMRKEAADAFKQYSSEGQSLIVKIMIETALSNNTVQVDLWYSSEFDLTEAVMAGFKRYLPKFGDRVIFNPRIKTKSCLFCSSEEQQGECLSGGRYCPFDPNSDYPPGLEKVKGKDVLRQSLRMKCVYMHEKEKTQD